MKLSTECSLCKQTSMETLSGWGDYERFSVCVNCHDILRSAIYASDGTDLCSSCNDPFYDEDTTVKCNCYLNEFRVHEPKGPGR